jgi:hypothetical protein
VKARAALLAGLLIFGCRTAPTQWLPLPERDPLPAVRMAQLHALVAERHALRATARASSQGPEGSGFANQLLLVERPASLRLEVIGLLQQRVLVLATDGERYELYRAEGNVREEGPVYPEVLDEVAGLPLTPEAAVGLLLAAPLLPEAPPTRAAGDGAGGLTLSWPEQTLEFDAQGRLVALRFAPGQPSALVAHWSEWRATPLGDFPHRLEVELPQRSSRLVLEYRQVELDPTLDPALFRLGLATR